MVKFVLEKDIYRLADAVYFENTTLSGSAAVNGLPFYRDTITEHCKNGVFYKVEVDSVFAGVYIIDLLNKNILFKNIRKTKTSFSGKIDLLLSEYFQQSSVNFVTSNSFILKDGVSITEKEIEDAKVTVINNYENKNITEVTNIHNHTSVGGTDSWDGVEW